MLETIKVCFFGFLNAPNIILSKIGKMIKELRYKMMPCYLVQNKERSSIALEHDLKDLPCSTNVSENSFK